jgi:hypothetical protein
MLSGENRGKACRVLEDLDAWRNLECGDSEITQEELSRFSVAEAGGGVASLWLIHASSEDMG